MMYLGRMADVDATERSPEDEGGRLEFETLLFDLSSSFINLPPEQVDREIEDVQRRVCEVLAVDLSALWEVTAAGGAPLKLTHFYSSQEDLLPPMRGMSAQEYFPWLHREMLAGRSVAVSSLEELPGEAAVDRDNLRLFGRQVESDRSAAGGGQVAHRGTGTQHHCGRSATGRTRW